MVPAMSESSFARGAVLQVVPLVTKQGDRFRVTTWLDGREIGSEVVPIERLLTAMGSATLGVAAALANVASIGVLREQVGERLSVAPLRRALSKSRPRR